ncbi:MAG: hypothetical protein RMJ43_06710 [Chloroherpetonaceae bacterium]|nr:hypothetical protein [Chthonomonadaceae bacterium]MDW8207511.1 hypothetical protein [Chloroherpetonaceae bacterium]
MTAINDSYYGTFSTTAASRCATGHTHRADRGNCHGRIQELRVAQEFWNVPLHEGAPLRHIHNSPDLS